MGLGDQVLKISATQQTHCTNQRRNQENQCLRHQNHRKILLPCNLSKHDLQQREYEAIAGRGYNNANKAQNEVTFFHSFWPFALGLDCKQNSAKGKQDNQIQNIWAYSALQ